MIWTVWFGVALFSFLTGMVVRERRNPGEYNRQLTRDRIEDVERLKQTRRGIITMRRELAMMRQHKTSWFGDRWFKALILWLSIRLYHLHLKTTTIFDEFDRFHGVDDKPGRVG